jgi:MoxR-like ATPase
LRTTASSGSPGAAEPSAVLRTSAPLVSSKRYFATSPSSRGSTAVAAPGAAVCRPSSCERPLLAAISSDQPVVLLIDELDRADEPFEAFLLEVLSDWQITIPEYGVVAARHPPRVVITSNRTREIHDALKRRCLYHWVEFPDLAREQAILRRKAPAAAAALSDQVVAFVQRMRGLDLFKSPGIAETIDWTHALVALDRSTLDPETVDDTLGVLLKYQEDIARVQGAQARRLLEEVAGATGPG